MPEPIESLDARRRFLSFTQEVALLTSLRLAERGFTTRSLPVEVTRRFPESHDARNALRQDLCGDLWIAPAAIARHAEWRRAEQRRLPAPVRSDDDEPASSYQRARWPCVSGRHQRLATIEIGRLALLPDSQRQAIERLATRRALEQLVAALGRRERLAVLSAFEGAESGLATTTEDDPQTLRLVAVEAFRTGFTRAAVKADGPEHLLDRFGTFVLAHALGAGFRVEARALAEARSLRAGRRLLRYHRRARRSPAVIADEARRVLFSAMVAELVPSASSRGES